MLISASEEGKRGGESADSEEEEEDDEDDLSRGGGGLYAVSRGTCVSFASVEPEATDSVCE